MNEQMSETGKERGAWVGEEQECSQREDQSILSRIRTEFDANLFKCSMKVIRSFYIVCALCDSDFYSLSLSPSLIIFYSDLKLPFHCEIHFYLNESFPSITNSLEFTFLSFSLTHTHLVD